MRFLLTNDDGIGAPGLELLAEVAEEIVILTPLAFQEAQEVQEW